MSDDAKYLDECLRLRGGVSPDPDDDRAIRNVLNALAAARREVETVTKERDEARAEARTLALTNETFVEDLATSRAALEDVRRLFRHYETVPCLSSLLGEDTDDECECAGCMARKWMAKHGRALAAQEGE